MRVDLYQDIKGEYFPALTRPDQYYRVRPDSKVELVTSTAQSSVGKVVENLRPKLSETKMIEIQNLILQKGVAHMTPINRSSWFFFSIAMFAATMMLSCSSVPMLNINYKVPEKTSQLEGKRVFFEIRDSRPDKDMFGEGAKEDFQNATETISLSVAEGNEKGFKVGIFPLSDLMKQIFRERLKSLGMVIEADREKAEKRQRSSVDIQAFKLELTPGTIKRNWKASMTYNVEISDKGKALATTQITGQSEKLKIIGRKEADSLVSDLVTDLVNRLDVQALLKQAGLV